MQEEQAQKRRILDLANRCYQTGVYTFSGFLNPGDQSLVYEMARELDFVPWMLFGGMEDCERRMLRFGSEEFLGYPEEFPISCLVVKPAAPKFADQLSHRDFLGALMNLGIERDVLGDIIVKDCVGYVFCEDAMAVFLREHLGKVKHTGVVCEIVKKCPAAARPDFSNEDLVVSADRCDAIVAKVYRLSRSQSVQLFAAKKVFVGGRQYENNSGALKAGDVVSVRGFGKFVYDGVISETKKGRIRVRIRRYV
ncbi:MAG: YlmH/Sll1252 family protein [Clostridiales bacterium]|nr:YlmH/Sll1252 family protein [Clostridiales bacterium]